MIKDLFSILSDDETLQFVRYLKARNRRGDARNVELFELMLCGKENFLKEELGSNAYNVLRNRLKHRMIDFIAQSTLQNQEGIGDTLSRSYLTAKRLLQHGKQQSAFKLLLTLEKDAFINENYTLEGEIQQFLIGNAHLPFAPKLNELYQRSKRNHQFQQTKTQLNLAYARIRLAYQAVEYQGEQLELTELLGNTFKEFSISDEIAFSFSSLRQLVQIADIHGAYSKNYHTVNLFFIDKLRKLQGGKSDTQENAIDHTEVLYTIANIYFRKKDFHSSSLYLEEMKAQMERFPSKLLKEYAIKWSMLRALNANHLGKAEDARKYIESVLNDEYTSDQTIQIRLALAMIQIQQQELRACQRTLSKFTRSDTWYERNLGIEWTLHKLTLEILLHIDLENYDYAESRLKSLLRKYKVYLDSDGKDQDKPFLLLVQTLLRDPSVVTSDTFHNRVEASIQWKKSEEEDVFRMNFYAWLKAKMNKGAVYPTLIDLLNSTN